MSKDLFAADAPEAGDQPLDASFFDEENVSSDNHDDTLGKNTSSNTEMSQLNENLNDEALKDFDSSDVLDSLDDFEMDVDEEDLAIETEKSNINPVIEDPNKTEEEKKDLDFDKSEDDQGKEDTENENKELALLNKTLKTDYKSLKEVREALGKEDQKEDPKIQQQYDHNKQAINWIQDVLKTSDTPALIKLDLQDKKIQSKGGEKLTEEELQEIETKIELMAENGTDEIYADNVKNKLNNVLEKRKSFNQNLDSKREKVKQNQVLSERKQLQESFAELYQQKDNIFYGVKVTPEDVKEAYKSIVSGDFFKNVQEDKTLTAELALFLKHRGKIRKIAGGPNYSDGVERVLNELGDNSSGKNRNKTSQASAVSQRRAPGNSEELVSRFLTS